MNQKVTLNSILDLPLELLRKSEKYDSYSSLLGEKQFSKYDYKKLKSTIKSYFEYYKNSIYFSHFPANQNIQLTTAYDSVRVSSTNVVSDSVSNLVISRIDKELEIASWILDFHSRILQVASKLTIQEASYLVDYFFSNLSEEVICEKLNICRKTLQKVKKSCLVKVWIELETLNLKEDA